MKIGLAFAGGGVRGSAHLGFVQALKEEGIEPTIFAGASAGSIVASLLATGKDPHDALREFIGASNNMVDVAYFHIGKAIVTSDRLEGVVSGKVLEETLGSIFAFRRLNGIAHPLGIVTTDIDNGKQVVFSNEQIPVNYDSVKIHTSDHFEWISGSYPLNEVIRASCSMPGIFVPKVIEGHKLVDGGISNNLPSDIAKALGADKVISLDLGYAGKVETKGVIDIAHMSINLLMKRVTDGNNQYFGLYMNPKIYDVRALDVKRIEECFERGYIYGKNNIGTVLNYLEN